MHYLQDFLRKGFGDSELFALKLWNWSKPADADERLSV
jgi:hypothetical protein